MELLVAMVSVGGGGLCFKGKIGGKGCRWRREAEGNDWQNWRTTGRQAEVALDGSRYLGR